MLMRNSCPLKKLDPNHTLKILSLNMGDLFLTKKNSHKRPPVVGFFEDLSTSFTLSTSKSTTSSFMPIGEGVIGIYFRKHVNSFRNVYWSKFHEVWINGRKCVIHENFIDPLPKGEKSNV